MVIIMRPGAPAQAIDQLREQISSSGINVSVINGVECTILGLIGDTETVDRDSIELNPHVERVMRVQEPFKKASRKFSPDNTVVQVGNVKIGGGDLVVAAGPCSVESREQIVSIAKDVHQSGARLLRGGAYKPRTSPYAFQGLAETGLELLLEAKQATGMPIVTEIISPKQVDIFQQHVDIIQVGARNMQNFDLLKELGRATKPILLKRGISCTIEEWLMSAEYILAGGNSNVILCERGIRTFETFTRNTLDVSAIPAIKKLSHLPILVDPSHATGMYWMVEPLSMAAVAAGADGLIIEVHNDPLRAKCDGPQSVTPKVFAHLMQRIHSLVKAMEA